MSDEPDPTEAERERDEYMRSIAMSRKRAWGRRRFRERFILPLRAAIERTRRWSFVLFVITACVMWLAYLVLARHSSH
jgi:hypothetical protein